MSEAEAAVDTGEVTPGAEGQSRDAQQWLDLISDAEREFQRYQEVSDRIDKLYADLAARASDSTNTDRQFAIFWANMEVLKPSIYSRPPIPVVVPRFKDRKELPRRASDMLERALCTSFDAADFNGAMELVRDDLATNARGVLWLRYEQDDEGERVCKEQVDRKDFLHDPARKWSEVGWVAKRSWLTRKKGVKRFGDAFLKAEAKNQVEEEGGRKRSRFPVWELWHKDENVVVWVSPGMEEVLDIRPPFLKLDGFFPCPRPAYATLKRRSLIPVPDFVYYKDQIEEINELTARISSLSESLRLKGFYPGGNTDVGDAIEAVLKDQSNTATLIPINSLAAFGTGALKDAVIWLPVRDVAEVITNLVALRKQLIEDVYEITGLSDIMRGQSVASETLGAQRLKSQYGSIRIRSKQGELVRIARDATRIEAEIMAENFSPQTLLAMSQVDDLPTDQAIAQQVSQIQQKAASAALDPATRAQAQQNPQQAQQLLQQVGQQIASMQQTVTVEKVMALLRAERLRPFVLEIETDSTIQPDEDAQKQRATEFVTAVGGYMAQAIPLVGQVPEAGPLAAEFLKYIASQFRAGRQLEGVVDQFADQMAESAKQPKGPSPEQIKQQADAQKAQADAQAAQVAAQQASAKAQIDMAGLKLEAQRQASEQTLAQQKTETDRFKAELAAITQIVVAKIGAQTDMDSASIEGQLAQILGLRQQQHEVRLEAMRQAAPQPQPNGAA